MRREEQFTRFEGFSILCTSFMFHVFSGSLPEMARECGNASWIALLIYSVWSIGLFFLYYLILRMFEGKDLLEINREILGPIFSKVTVLLLLLFFLIYCINNLCEAVDLLAVNTYSHTRSIMLGAAFLCVAYLICMYPIKGLARTTSVAVWLFFLSITFILAMAYNQYDAGYLTPILGYGWKPIFKTSVFQLSNLHGLLLIGMFAKSFSSSREFKACGIWGVCVGNLSFVLSALFYSMSGPYHALVERRAGLLDIAQSIYINRFFQRLESIFIIFVCMGKLLVLGLGALAIKRLFAELFDIPPKYQKNGVFPLLIIVLCGTQALFNLPLLRDAISDFLRNSSLFFVLALLALWLVGGYFKRHPGKGRSTLKAASLLLICCMIAPLFSGCNEAGEPDEEIFAIIMGYDRSDPETLRITMKIMPEDKNSAGGSGGGFFADQEGAPGSDTPPNVFTVDAPCNIPAVDLINTVIPKHLSLLHVKMLVISEDLAREDIDMLITPIIRYNEIKSTIAVVICDGTAEEYIAAQTSELIPFLPLETEMILKENKGNASYMVRTMGQIHDTYTGNYGDPIVMYGGLTRAARETRVTNEMKAGVTDDPRGSTISDVSPGSLLGDTDTVDIDKSDRPGEPALYPPEPEQSQDESSSAQNSGMDESSAAGPPEEESSPGNEDMGGMNNQAQQPQPEESQQSSSSSANGGSSEEGEEEEPDISQFDANKLDLENWQIGGDPYDSTKGDVPEIFFDDPSLGYLNGYLPGQIPIKTAAETQIAGMAVIREKQMVGTLNTHYTRLFMLADGGFNGAVMTVRDPYKQDFYIIFYANSRQRNRIKTHIDEQGKAHIEIECFVQAELAIVQNTEKDYKQTAETEILRQYTKEYLESEMEKLIFKIQKEYDADILELGRYVSNNFTTIQQWEAYNWRERYRDAEIKVTVNLKL